MRSLWARVLVILKAAPAWLGAASTVVTFAAAELDELVPAAPRIAAVAVTWLATAIAIIRRVTPVLPDERGLLPTNQEA